VTALIILVNLSLPSMLRNYTAAGRMLLNDILGFREFLRQAEQDRIQRLNPQGEPIHAEQEYLPYAIALDLREDWGDQLAVKTILETAL
jgi:Predicted membrane protein (DUF2207)